MEIEGYSDFSLIGSGGNAHVYRATQLETDEVVAVKILHGGGDDAVARRFDRERNLMSQLDAIASVVPVYESGFLESGDPFIVMPLYEGGSLQDRVDAGPMPWREAVQITKIVAESIALAHAKRILHLDVKPANVLLDDKGHPWLADFGIAEAMGPTSSMSAKMMTPAFTSPERIEGGEPDEQSDTYGLAALLFALLAGRRPYVTEKTSNVIAVATAVQNDPLPIEWIDDDVPRSVKNLLLRGMAKNPDDRPRSAIEFVGLLEDVIDDRGVAAPVAASLHDLAPTIDESEIVVAGPDRANRLRLVAVLGLLMASAVVAMVLQNNDSGSSVEAVRVEEVELAAAEAVVADPTTTSQADVEVVDLEVVEPAEEEPEPAVGEAEVEVDEPDADDSTADTSVESDVAVGESAAPTDTPAVAEPAPAAVEVEPIESEVAGATETKPTTTSTAAPTTTTTTSTTTTTTSTTTTTEAEPVEPAAEPVSTSDELCAGGEWVTDRVAVNPPFTAFTNKTADALRGPSTDASCNRGFAHAQNAEFLVTAESGDFYWAEGRTNNDVGWIAKADLSVEPAAPPKPAASDEVCPNGEWMTDRVAVNPPFIVVTNKTADALRGPSTDASCNRGFAHAQNAEFLVTAESGDFYWVESTTSDDVGWIAKVDVSRQ